MQSITIRSMAVAGALIAGAGSAQADGPKPGLGTWETSLLSRDINGDGEVDGYYDTVRDITWLANPKLGAGTVHDDGFSTTDGRFTFAGATHWLDSLDVHGVTGWRFANEVSSLFFETLGNTAIPFGPTAGWYNTGNFVNVVDFPPNSGWYWTGTTPYQDPSCAPQCPMFTEVFWADGVGAGVYYDIAVTSSMSVWAVHDGDVAVVPEPQTWALMAAGLGLFASAARRRRG